MFNNQVKRKTLLGRREYRPAIDGGGDEPRRQSSVDADPPTDSPDSFKDKKES